MAKLYFRYGAMNSGKSTNLLQVAYNYEERGLSVVLIKPLIDTKGANKIVSRLGVERKVDYLIEENADIPGLLFAETDPKEISAILVDEAQFLSRRQIDDLFRIAANNDIPVIAYGLRTDFQTNVFEGSARLLELAHSIEELKTICRCGKKALFNTRKLSGQFVFSGDQVSIEGGSVHYEPLCATCYLLESDNKLGEPHSQ